MGFLKQFHLVIKYKKGTKNKVDDMLSRPSLNVVVVVQNSSLKHESYLEKYAMDANFKDVYEALTQGTHIQDINYHVHNRFLYHLGKLCIPQIERPHVIREAHSSHI